MAAIRQEIIDIEKIVLPHAEIYFIDLFAGAGGVSTGIHEAVYEGNKVAHVLAAINHDKTAIESHAMNHPGTLHFVEDIRTIELSPLSLLVARVRRENPHAEIHIWASLECTNFSKAKGGLPRDGDSRTLAEHLFRYIDALNPDVLWIENVEEFMSWGPLDDNGKPVSRYEGRDYIRWTNKIQSYGYRFDWQILNCANYGAYTSRKRYFAIFAKPVCHITFPKATHSKKPSSDMFGGLRKWKAVRDVLDLNDHGNSIIDRDKPLSEKTLERIYAGLEKYIAKGEDAFIAQYYTGKAENKVRSMDVPAGSVTTIPHESIVQPICIVKFLSNNAKTGINAGASLDVPSHTVTTQGRMNLLNGEFLMQYYSGDPKNHVHGTDKPCDTLTTKDRYALVNPEFMVQYNGTADQPCDIDMPCKTITTKDRFGLVNPIQFINRSYSQATPHASIEQPCDTVMVVPKQSIVTVWVMNPQYNDVGRDLDQPSVTITTTKTPYLAEPQFLLNPQFNNNGSSIENPCFTLIAKMDKRPPYLITTEGGQVAIAVFESDSPAMVKIKSFMAAYGLIDIKMRMLKIVELKRITGFNEKYVLLGTQAEQKKFIGNAVPPKMVKALIENYYEVNK